MAEIRDRLLDWIGRLLCWFGFHHYRLIEVICAFGGSGTSAEGGMPPLRIRHHALRMKLF